MGRLSFTYLAAILVFVILTVFSMPRLTGIEKVPKPVSEMAMVKKVEAALHDAQKRIDDLKVENLKLDGTIEVLEADIVKLIGANKVSYMVWIEHSATTHA